LPEPVTNTILFGYEIDVLYPAERVIIEVDGYEFHSDRDSFGRDRKRDAVMLAHDYQTVRITAEHMEDDPEHEAQLLMAILDNRRRTLTVLSNTTARVPATGARTTPERPAS
jgi:very-short-patch-repair endonuclease